MRPRDVQSSPDAETFASHYRERYRELTRLVAAVTRDYGLAQEAAQEALTRLWEAQSRGRSPSDPTAWTATVALNWARSRLRRRGSERRALWRLGGHRNGDQPASASQLLSEDLGSTLQRLPYRQREVAVLHYCLDLDIATIARNVRISEGAVKNALFHARSSLRKQLDPADHPEAQAHRNRNEGATEP